VIGEDGRVRAKGLCNEAARLRELLSAAGMNELAGMVAADDSDGARRGVREVREPGYDRAEREEKGVTT